MSRRYSVISRPPIKPPLPSAPLAAVFAAPDATVLNPVLAGVDNDGGIVWSETLGGSVLRAVGYPAVNGYPAGVITVAGRDRRGAIDTIMTPADPYIRNYADTGELLWRWRVPSPDRFNSPYLDAVPDGAGGAYFVHLHRYIWHVNVYGVARVVAHLQAGEGGMPAAGILAPRAVALSHDKSTLFVLLIDASLSLNKAHIVALDVTSGVILWSYEVWGGAVYAFPAPTLLNVGATGDADYLIVTISQTVLNLDLQETEGVVTRAISLPDGPATPPSAAAWEAENTDVHTAKTVLTGDQVIVGTKYNKPSGGTWPLRANNVLTGAQKWGHYPDDVSALRVRLERFCLAAWGDRLVSVTRTRDDPTGPQYVEAVTVGASAVTLISGWTITPPVERPLIVQLTSTTEAAPAA